MPYSRRTGQRYAAGSAATWGAYDSRICCVCGRKIALKHGAHMHHEAGEHRSSHLDCGFAFTKPLQTL